MSNEQPLLLHSWPNAIIHIDGDAFFASCEQSIHPALKGQPVITGQERNIVASMSYEAKALGIKRGTALWEARRVCPQVVILPSDYEAYSLISKRMFSIIRRFTPMVEESSIDEGFADLKGLRRLYRTGYAGIAVNIKDTIERELDIPISLGLSVTKTLAKLAAKHKKPRGFTVVKGSRLHTFLPQISVNDVCGIGPNTTALLAKRGIFTAYEYATKPERWVQQLLGKIGVELWHELRGEVVYQLDTAAKTSYQSILKSKTFTPASSDYAYVKAQLFRNTESACIKMRRYHLRAKRLIIFLRTQDFGQRGLQADLSRASASPIEMFPLIEEMLRAIYQPGVLYRTTGIVLANLEEDGALQFELFEDAVRMIGMKHLFAEIDEINKRYGKHTVHAATGLFLKRTAAAKPQLEGRHALAQRKTDLLPGETYRQRVNLPLWRIKV